jgi:hypothetical protein
VINSAQKPNPEELPSRVTLFRSSIVAIFVAIAIAVTVVLPAEYAIDPTGIGRALGLTEMGEIKAELAAEAQRDLEHHRNDQSLHLFDGLLSRLTGTAYAAQLWREEVTFTLVPGQSAEIKLQMSAGNTAQYAWFADGGRINFDLHAHGDGESVTYERGRGETSGDGSFTARFDGVHGWFWRNRDNTDVTITLQLQGSYTRLIESY